MKDMQSPNSEVNPKPIASYKLSQRLKARWYYVSKDNRPISQNKPLSKRDLHRQEVAQRLGKV